MQVQCDHHSEPDRVDAHTQQYRADNRHDHEGDLDKVENKTEQKDHQHHHQCGGKGAARQRVEQLVDQLVATEPAEYQRKDRRAEQNHEHHGADFGGGLGHLAQLDDTQLPLAQRQQTCPQRADSGGLGRCGDTTQNGAEHRHDQQQRWQQAAQQVSD